MTTSEPEPFDSDDLKAMWRVLANWVRTAPKEALGASLAKRVVAFPPVANNVLEHTLPKHKPPVDLDSYGWIVGGRLPRYGRPIIPIASVITNGLVDGRVGQVNFRVALLHEREDGTVHAEGWRFESAEAFSEEQSSSQAAHDENKTDSDLDVPAHPYAHAQAIFGWRRENPCLIHPPHTDGDPCDGVDPVGDASIDAERLRVARATLATHPAFPLMSTTLTGLAVAVVASLYGARPARKIVEGDTALERMGGAVGRDLDFLLARA